MDKNKKRMKKYGKVSLPINYLVLLIILVIVIFLVVFFVFRLGWIQEWKIFLPDWIVGNQSYYGERGCPSGSFEVAYLDSRNYIILNGSRTNIYILGNKIYLDDGSSFKKDNQIGFIHGKEKGYLIVITLAGFNPDDRYSYNTNSLLPNSKDERRLLFYNPFLEGSSICLSSEMMNYINSIMSCKLTCELVEGVCRSNCLAGEVYNGQIDCPNGQYCCVKETAEFLSSENITLLSKSYFENVFFSKTQVQKDILNNNIFKGIPGTRYALAMFVKRNVPICYSFDSNTKYIESGFRNSDDNEETCFIAPKPFTYSNEKFIEFVAWNKDLNQKVIKRWKLIPVDVTEIGFDPGKIIIDSSDFREKMKNADEGDRFYVFLEERNDWEKSTNLGLSSELRYTFVYKIEKKGDRICIYAWDEKIVGESSGWHLLDCAGLGRDCILISDIENSFKETLDNKCSWN
ncbi:MAG: hypothetical protein QXW97_01875 [Candidatus Pacearchaeota archaeon]